MRFLGFEGAASNFVYYEVPQFGVSLLCSNFLLRNWHVTLGFFLRAIFNIYFKVFLIFVQGLFSIL